MSDIKKTSKGDLLVLNYEKFYKSSNYVIFINLVDSEKEVNTRHVWNCRHSFRCFYKECENNEILKFHALSGFNIEINMLDADARNNVRIFLCQDNSEPDEQYKEIKWFTKIPSFDSSFFKFGNPYIIRRPIESPHYGDLPFAHAEETPMILCHIDDEVLRFIYAEPTRFNMSITCPYTEHATYTVTLAEYQKYITDGTLKQRFIALMPENKWKEEE